MANTSAQDSIDRKFEQMVKRYEQNELKTIKLLNDESCIEFEPLMKAMNKETENKKTGVKVKSSSLMELQGISNECKDKLSHKMSATGVFNNNVKFPIEREKMTRTMQENQDSIEEPLKKGFILTEIFRRQIWKIK